jgi:hypothetical protein
VTHLLLSGQFFHQLISLSEKLVDSALVILTRASYLSLRKSHCDFGLLSLEFGKLLLSVMLLDLGIEGYK